MLVPELECLRLTEAGSGRRDGEGLGGAGAER